jgi:hypothetical protein
VHLRQVNERWLDQFRPWVYGAGFGWQIGTGLATYIKTAAVFLLIVLAGMTASPALALALGTLFGLVRGAAVLLGRGSTSPAALATFHRRFTAAGPVALGLTVVVELAVALTAAAVLSPWVAGALVLLSVVALADRARRRTPVTAPTIGPSPPTTRPPRSLPSRPSASSWPMWTGRSSPPTRS